MDAVDAYDVELAGSLSRADVRDGLETGEPAAGRYASRIVDTVRRAAAAHEHETGETPEWVDAVNYHDLPGIGRRVRPVFDHWSAKASYVDADRDVIVQLPASEPTLQGRLEQVMTWQHNRDVIADASVTPVNDYDIALTAVDGEPMPVAVSDFNDSLLRYDAMTPDQQADWHGTFRETAATLADLIAEGDVACANANDYWYSGAPSDIALDTEAGAPVVIDVGELQASSWGHITPIPYDAREEFLAAHGIDDHVDTYLDALKRP